MPTTTKKKTSRRYSAHSDCVLSFFFITFNYRNKLEEQNNGIEWSLNTILIALYEILVIWAREQIYNNNNTYETHLEIDVRLSERRRRNHG